MYVGKGVHKERGFTQVKKEKEREGGCSLDRRGINTDTVKVFIHSGWGSLYYMASL